MLSKAQEPQPSVNSATESESPPSTGQAVKPPSPSTSRQAPDKKISKTALFHNSSPMALLEAPKLTPKSKSKNGLTDSEASSKSMPEDK